MRRPPVLWAPQGALFSPDRLRLALPRDPCNFGVLQRPSYEHLSSQLSGSTFHTPTLLRHSHPRLFLMPPTQRSRNGKPLLKVLNSPHLWTLLTVAGFRPLSPKF